MTQIINYNNKMFFEGKFKILSETEPKIEYDFQNSDKYVKIGYTDDNKIWQNSHSGQHFYIIKDVDKYSPHGENVKACVNILQCWMYIIPKNNDQELFSKEYDALMHKYRHAPSDVHYPIATVYDLKFKTHQIVIILLYQLHFKFQKMNLKKQIHVSKIKK